MFSAWMLFDSFRILFSMEAHRAARCWKRTLCSPEEWRDAQRRSLTCLAFRARVNANTGLQSARIRRPLHTSTNHGKMTNEEMKLGEFMFDVLSFVSKVHAQFGG